MPRAAKKKKPTISSAKASKYDAHHKVIDNTYGDFADLRHQLSESKEDVAERSNLLKMFADCPDSQRSWLLLEDYFDKIQLNCSKPQRGIVVMFQKTPEFRQKP